MRLCEPLKAADALAIAVSDGHTPQESDVNHLMTAAWLTRGQLAPAG